MGFENRGYTVTWTSLGKFIFSQQRKLCGRFSRPSGDDILMLTCSKQQHQQQQRGCAKNSDTGNNFVTFCMSSLMTYIIE